MITVSSCMQVMYTVWCNVCKTRDNACNYMPVLSIVCYPGDPSTTCIASIGRQTATAGLARKLHAHGCILLRLSMTAAADTQQALLHPYWPCLILSNGILFNMLVILHPSVQFIFSSMSVVLCK